MPKIAITAKGIGFGSIHLDDLAISAAVRAVDVHVAGDIPQVTVELGLFEIERLDTEEAEVVIPDDVAETLTVLGWTPPGDPGRLTAAYRERARLVAHLAAQYPAVITYADQDEPDWPIVYVDTPAGQLSWHLSKADLDLFPHVSTVGHHDPRAEWDGHTAEQKYERLAQLTTPTGDTP